MRSHGSLAASWLPYCIGSATLCFCFFTLLEFIFLASSPEFVGEIRFREFAKLVI